MFKHPAITQHQTQKGTQTCVTHHNDGTNQTKTCHLRVPTNSPSFENTKIRLNEDSESSKYSRKNTSTRLSRTRKVFDTMLLNKVNLVADRTTSPRTFNLILVRSEEIRVS